MSYTYTYTVTIKVSEKNPDQVKKQLDTYVSRLLDNATFLTQKDELLLESNITQTE